MRIWKARIGTANRVVPVSTMAWHPEEQATGAPLTETLGRGMQGEPGLPKTPAGGQGILAIPLHGDLPVGFGRERDPGDASGGVVGINATEEDKAPSSAVSGKGDPSRVVPSPTTPPFPSENGASVRKKGEIFSSFVWDLPAQVDREKIPIHEVFPHHVVEDRGGSGGGNAWECQSQDAVKGGVVEEIPRLCLSQPENLVADVDPGNLGERRQVWIGHDPTESHGMRGLQRLAVRQRCHIPGFRSCFPCRRR